MTKIVLENITVKYPEKMICIKNNLELAESTYLICGPNGEGKTTLMNVLTKKVKYEGKIEIDSRELRSYSRKEISKKISQIGQEAVLFENLTISENIKLLNLNFETINELLGYFKKGDKLDVPIMQLSGGEKQIVNIVFGLSKPSEILLLDEPLNNISVIQKKRVQDLIERDQRFKIIISHTPLDINAKVLKLESGELVYV